ncbi:helix-turn-helix transcriptional regulator [Dyadobacter sp. CY326]|uniref:helix-turn-helix transcriptional regulator n=1 Tax=Dyadobacter sp. CY326 TaxID=2907300 RepID=UPI001F25DC71|nr:helix-turn-helix transcriptional regulator [Dyadobacter sp. CY326]MCE7064454.1 helix-turn-helix transcriptional regulator [Dyadobacter sp. CY326]
MKLTIIVEKSDNELWGRIENVPNYLPVTSGNTLEEITSNLRDLLEDFIQHEGQASGEWGNLKAKNFEFDYAYDLSAFFELFDDIKVGALAKRAGLNPSLVRHYVAGTKFPSEQQAKKLEDAIHDLGEKLKEVVLA